MSANCDHGELRRWRDGLRDLCAGIQREVRACIREALETGERERLGRAVGQGAGDVTYGVDVPAEAALERWFFEEARKAPLSVFSEDAGWRHRGPDSRGGGSRELPGFDHGGPRIVFDPVDGSRNLMVDLRSAWTVVSFCGPGDGVPNLSDVVLGVLSEIADSRGASYRVLWAYDGEPAGVELRSLADDALLRSSALLADGDDRVDHGYYSFFRYDPAGRPELARIEAEFFALLEREEGAELLHCFDDQYISNGGQLALLALGPYRLIAELRAFLAARAGQRATTSKPYDCAGALYVARSAGCAVLAADGGELEFPLDATTPVSFVGYANEALARRLERHLRAVLDA